LLYEKALFAFFKQQYLSSLTDSFKDSWI